MNIRFLCPCFVAIRLVHSGRQQRSAPGDNDDLFLFGTRSGVSQGVDGHVFKVETLRDLSGWTRALVHGVNNAVMLVKEVATCWCIHFLLDEH